MGESTIIYTLTDEAPMLATFSFLPVIEAFAGAADVEVQTRDISLAGRVLAAFPEALDPDQRISDDLAELGELVTRPEANVIKLPNISASIPQLKATIDELRAKGLLVPEYPDEPSTDDERSIKARYDKVKGSAVNPVLREGNSDRRAPASVKAYARSHPHSMGAWSPDSKTRVATMGADDFRNNEQSVTVAAPDTLRIELVADGGETTVLKELPVIAGEVVDATVLHVAALDRFLAEQLAAAKADDVLFSIHLKATMMKVSDPIIFGHAVTAFLQPVFDKHGPALAAAGVNPNSGLGALLERVAEMPDHAAIEADIEATLAARPPLYMVNSDKGITNLHVPSDVIVDASMPALIRAGGKGWGPDGKAADSNCVIPDSSYAGVFSEAIAYFKETGALDPRTAGTMQNVGLMAQKPEEYGSHPTTFEIAADGIVRMRLSDGTVLHQHRVEKGDIWRSASTRKAPIEDWVQLAIDRQRLEGCQAIFWLDETRAHDAELIRYVKPILAARGVADKFRILAPAQAVRVTLETIRKGENSIAVSGNVLRDYLTDLFPILELGTSAKMLSIVKLMQGGGMFETGAGGSAPKHVEQLVEENHLRWDSLGEFCAIGESFKYLADRTGNARAQVLGDAVDQATQGILDNDRSPERKVGQPDTRDSHFYFALYWAQALAAQAADAGLAAHFAPIAKALGENEAKIAGEFAAVQGKPADLGGYYHTDPVKTAAVMRPSATLNAIIG